MACNIEPCGCDESNALREVLEDVLIDTDGEPCPTSASGCQPGCMCSRNRAGELLAALEKARANIAAAGTATPRFINITFTVDDTKPKQGEFKWE